MSCISNNFSSFFLNSLNDSSEFAKYLSNGELKFSSFEDFQVFGSGASQHQQQQQQQQYSTTQQQHQLNSSNSAGAVTAGGPNSAEIFNSASHMESNNYAHPSATAAAAATTASHQHHAPQSPQQPHSQPHAPAHHPPQHFGAAHAPHSQPPTTGVPNNFHHNQHHHSHLATHHNVPAISGSSNNAAQTSTPQGYGTPQRWPTAAAPGVPLHSNHPGAQHFDGSFEFLKYLRHSSDFSCEQGSSGDATSNASTVSTVASSVSQQQQQTSSLIDLDSSTSHKSRSSRKVAALLSSVSRASNSLDSCTLDVFDHDSKHTLFDLHHMTNGSNSNESSLEISNFAFPNSHLNASNSNTSSEGAAAGNSDLAMLNSASNSPKPLATFSIKENFDVHSSHKVEEGIFQHMNKLPTKKKENLKQLGVRFTGQMTLSDKSIVVENFIKFCQEYDVKDHRPFLSLNQSGLNKPEQIKFARYLGQGLPTFTLFCIYSNFKNLFCTKRTEIYIKDGYNLPYILDKTKRFLSNTTADLKNMIQQQSNDGIDAPPNGNNNISNHNHNNNVAASTAEVIAYKCIMPKALENFVIYENFDVPETHRIEDGVCTHITRLPPKKQEILKQFGIQSSQPVTYYEKYIVIENFIKFCNEYKVADHRPFLDFHESGLPKAEQLKFVRYLGQGLPNLTLNKIFVAFKDILGLNRIDKIVLEGYNLDMILKKKKKNLYNRMHAAAFNLQFIRMVLKRRGSHIETPSVTSWPLNDYLRELLRTRCKST